MERVTIPFAGRDADFDLDRNSRRWTSVESATPLAEGEFPLIASAGGKRYELYSDGTFAEVERGARTAE
jgi:hypothetical protein